MKGLILKDLMCLRKQRIIYIYLITVILILSVMLVLSAKFGNLYRASLDMIGQNPMGDIEITIIINVAMILFLLGPIAMAGEAAITIFSLDGKAGFANVYACLPISINKKVLAKYVTVLIMIAFSCVTDILVAAILSVLTDIIKFSEFLGIIISVSSIIFTISAASIFFCFCVGYGKEMYAELIPIIIMAISFIALNYSKIKQFFVATDGSDLLLEIGAVNVLKDKFYIPLCIAAVVGIVSCFGSIIVAKRKRGML